MAELRRSVDLDVTPEQLWTFLVDWERQGDWMPLTRVRATENGGEGVGAGIEGWTGIGPVGVRDPMTIRVWEPYERIVMRHHGPVLRGSGAFEIADLGGGRSRFTWSEWLDLPFGALGRLGWTLVLGPLTGLFYDLALRRLARRVRRLP